MCSNLKWHKKHNGQKGNKREASRIKRQRSAAAAKTKRDARALTYGRNGACCQKCSWPKRISASFPSLDLYILCYVCLTRSCWVAWGQVCLRVVPISTLVLGNVMNFSGQVCVCRFIFCLVFFSIFFGLSWLRCLCQRLLMLAMAKCFSIYFILRRGKKNNLLAPSVLSFMACPLQQANCFGRRVSARLIDVATILQHNFRLTLERALRIACARAGQLAVSSSSARRRRSF